MKKEKKEKIKRSHFMIDTKIAHICMLPLHYCTFINSDLITIEKNKLNQFMKELKSKSMTL